MSRNGPTTERTRWVDLDQSARIEAVIDAAVDSLARGWSIYFTQRTGELLSRELPECDPDTGEPLALWNKENSDRATIEQFFDDLGPDDRPSSSDYRDDFLLTLATGTKSNVAVLRIPAYLYYRGILENLARHFDKPPLKPSSYGDGCYNFIYKLPADFNPKIKTIPIRIVPAGDVDFESWRARRQRQESQGSLIIMACDNELRDGDLIVRPKQPPDEHIRTYYRHRGLPDEHIRTYYRHRFDASAERAAPPPRCEFGDIEVLGDGDRLLLPPTIGYWLDDNNDETSVMPDVGDMPAWLAGALGLLKEKKEEEDDDDESGVTLKSFVAYMPLHSYIYIPTREPWPGSSVNSRIKPRLLLGPDGKPLLDKNREPKFISASAWLDKNRPVEQMTWAPGEEMLIRDRLVADGGWFDREGVTCFNLYRPPTIVLGDANDVGPWLDHVHKIYPTDAEHILNFLAHRRQRPYEKIDHALVLGGWQGIGKDTIIEPVKQAVGPWNFIEITPGAVMGRFNGHLKAVILRINEARDLGEVNRYQFYEHMKPYTAAPPDVLRVDEKNLREHSIFNVCGIIITSNHKTDGLYLPADDRRHYVAWSTYTKEDFKEDYWNKIWSWYGNGGYRNVAAYLAARDISAFNSKAPPPKTEAFLTIVNANRAPEENELADLLEEMGNPNAVTIGQITVASTGDLCEWIMDRKNLRIIPLRLEECGYVVVLNDTSKQGLWRIGEKRQAIYAKTTLTRNLQIVAARELIEKLTGGKKH